MEYNSERNQEIKRQFVQREVVYCVSNLIYELGKNEDYMEDIMEFSSRPDYEQAVLDHDAIHVQYSNCKGGWVWVNKSDHEVSVTFYAEDEAYQDAVYENNLDYGYIEAYEHWIVTDWLADKLGAQGEMVTKDFLGLTIWGRQTSGQAILLDWVISKICEDMGILEGQCYEWKEK
jgi:hypothetical protein